MHYYLQVTEPNHFIITQFHVDHPFRPDIEVEEWLQHRLGYFEKFCLPSVLGQTQRKFTWVLFYSPNSPSWVPPYLESIQHEATVAIPLNGYVCNAMIVSAIKPLLTRPVVITSRLDSDDALANDAVDRIHNAITTDGVHAINFTNGLRLTNSGLLKTKDSSNPFISLVEDVRRSPLRTVTSRPHHDMGRVFPVTQIEGSPGWMQVLHEHNVSNIPAGLPTNPQKYSAMFPGLSETSTWSLSEYYRLVRPDRVLKRRFREKFASTRR